MTKCCILKNNEMGGMGRAMINDYVYSVVSFTWNSETHMGVIVGIGSNNRAICYRVIKSGNKRDYYVSIEGINGKKSNLQIVHESRFYLPNNHFDKVICQCTRSCVAEANAKYSELKPIPELEKEYKCLKEQLKGPRSAENKDQRKALNQLVGQINNRKCLFLSGTDKQKKEKNPYSNFRLLPDKNGITAVFHGGGCSGK